MIDNSKRDYYKILMHKMSEAHEHKFYLESSWYAFAILEDRLLSALRQTAGGTHYGNNRPIRMLGNKIGEINLRRKNDNLLNAYFNDELMNEISIWKDERNDLMHALAEGTRTIEEILRIAKSQSSKGKSLIKKTCTAARLLKKNRFRVQM